MCLTLMHKPPAHWRWVHGYSNGPLWVVISLFGCDAKRRTFLFGSQQSLAGLPARADEISVTLSGTATVWGLCDDRSWLNAQHSDPAARPLLFDEDFIPKQAWHEVTAKARQTT